MYIKAPNLYKIRKFRIGCLHVMNQTQISSQKGESRKENGFILIFPDIYKKSPRLIHHWDTYVNQYFGCVVYFLGVLSA